MSDVLPSERWSASTIWETHDPRRDSLCWMCFIWITHRLYNGVHMTGGIPRASIRDVPVGSGGGHSYRGCKADLQYCRAKKYGLSVPPTLASLLWGRKWWSLEDYCSICVVVIQPHDTMGWVPDNYFCQHHWYQQTSRHLPSWGGVNTAPDYGQVCPGSGGTRDKGGLWDGAVLWVDGGGNQWGCPWLVAAMVAALPGGGLGFSNHWHKKRVQWGELDGHAMGHLVLVARWHMVYI